jgi:hypothetical protein
MTPVKMLLGEDANNGKEKTPSSTVSSVVKKEDIKFAKSRIKYRTSRIKNQNKDIKTGNQTPNIQH